MTEAIENPIRPSDLIGRSLGVIPTPALIVDVDVLERNLDCLSALAGNSATRLRPHGKAHKCPNIAAMQIARGAVGICCQTVKEVEAFAAAGITNILLTNQIVHHTKARRLARLAQTATIGVCVDSLYHVELLAKAATEQHAVFDVYIEIEVGGHRCGVPSLAEALILARSIGKADGLSFGGVQAYNGRAQHIRAWKARNATVRETMSKTQTFIDALERSGLQCKLVTGGGSGSVEIDIDAAVLTELQCGSYALMDADYLSVLRTNGDSLETLFSPALFVVTSVISVRSPNYVVIDAGLKSMGLDSGPPIVCSNANLLYRNPSDEHGVLFAPEITTLPFLGERLHLIPSHCDPTIALHDRLYAVKDGRVDAIWSIVGRGEW